MHRSLPLRGVSVVAVLLLGALFAPAQDVKPLLPRNTTAQQADLIARLDKVIKPGEAVLLQNTTMHDLVRFLSSWMGVSVALVTDEYWGQEMSVSVKDMTMDAVLRMLVGPRGNYAVVGNCICVGSSQDVQAVFSKTRIAAASLSEEDKELLASLEEKRITISFISADPVTALHMTARQAHCRAVVDEIAAINAVPHVAVSLRDVAFSTALRVMCGPDLNCGIRDGTIYVSTDEGLKKMMGRK